MLKIVVAFLMSLAVAQAAISGFVVDSTQKPVENAVVEFKSLSGVVLFTTKSAVDGHFEWPSNYSGSIRIRVHSAGLESYETISTQPEVRIQLAPSSQYTSVTVTATRGVAEPFKDSAHISTLIEEQDIRKRHLLTIGNALEGAPGVLVQQSSTAQVSPFLRGLTGYQVLNLLDGIRFNNSTFRSGPNQYLAFIEPSQAQRIEALLGPAGVQYGSDSLGGAIHVITQEPRFADSGRQIHGNFSVAGASADLSGVLTARISAANEKWFGLIGASGRKHNDLRAGRGFDSRNVFRRFFGMPLDSVRDLVGSRLQDTGFQQYGLETKLAFRPANNQQLTINYQRAVQEGVRGYKDLLGGLGRLISDFSPQHLNWFYARYEVLEKGFFDSISGTFSINQQKDGSRRQNLLFTDPITTDRSTVNTFGYTTQANTHRISRVLMSFGSDTYGDHVSSERDVLNPLSNLSTRTRPLYPDGSRYRSYGLFAQGSYQLHRKLKASAGVRWTAIQFNDRQNRLWFRDTTFHSTLRWDITGDFGLHGVVSRGFRAPNLNDLGALGLNDLGYEIPAVEAIPAGALLSTDSGEGALSKGARIRKLSAESLMNYEFGMRITKRKLFIRAQGFDAELSDPISRRTLLFPASNVPAALAGLAVNALPPTAAQRSQGVVTVATSVDARAVKAFVNDGASRYYGLEFQGRYFITSRLSLDGNYGYLVGRDLNPNRNIRRLPPQSGTITLRHTPTGRRPWIEISTTATGAQRRLNGGDIDDERIGASIRRSDVASFFNGTRVLPYLVGGSQVFQPTGETLLQIQNRVLPGFGDSTRVPVYASTAGWSTVAIRAGMPIGERWQAMAAIENLLDHNYRMHGSGFDAPGFNAYLNLSYRF